MLVRVSVTNAIYFLRYTSFSKGITPVYVTCANIKCCLRHNCRFVIGFAPPTKENGIKCITSIEKDITALNRAFFDAFYDFFLGPFSITDTVNGKVHVGWDNLNQNPAQMPGVFARNSTTGRPQYFVIDWLLWAADTKEAAALMGFYAVWNSDFPCPRCVLGKFCFTHTDVEHDSRSRKALRQFWCDGVRSLGSSGFSRVGSNPPALSGFRASNCTSTIRLNEAEFKSLQPFLRCGYMIDRILPDKMHTVMVSYVHITSALLV
jgi:hypothetical protein